MFSVRVRYKLLVLSKIPHVVLATVGQSFSACDLGKGKDECHSELDVFTGFEQVVFPTLLVKIALNS